MPSRPPLYIPNTPPSPLLFPSFPPLNRRRATAKLLAGVLGFCHRNPWIPATPGDPAAPFQFLFTPLVLAHHLKRLVCLKSQGNRTPHCHPTRPTPGAPPATSPPHHRKRKTTPTKPPSSPSFAVRRPRLPRRLCTPERAHVDHQCRTSPENCPAGESPSQICSHPLDLKSKGWIKSLTQRGMLRSESSRSL
jgi:hypothetical protein